MMDVEAEHKAALGLGYYYWHREGEKWRAVADDKARATGDRQDAIKRMESAWAFMRACREASCWFQGDLKERLAGVTVEKEEPAAFFLQETGPTDTKKRARRAKK